MSVLGAFTQQPAETKDYDISYADWMPAGDTVASATSTVTPTGPTLLDPMVSSDGLWTKHWLSGVTAGTKYKIEVTATTNGGRVIQNEFYVRGKEF